jgi:hypothetical protein
LVPSRPSSRFNAMLRANMPMTLPSRGSTL